MSDLILRLADGTVIALPPSLQTISTYVLLEQEAWFEKEASFVLKLLKPGMTAIDIGANAGVYALAMARMVGASGTVYAYEPASAPRALLERSRGLNGFPPLYIAASALSDSARQGHLVFGGSSELHSLAGAGEGETVRVTSLDEEDRLLGWRAPDFVKIDAEGEEARILEGGRNFFTKHSPLVMFEVKAGTTLNRDVMKRFVALGYRIFRLLPGAPILVPVTPEESIDDFELNLFAAKPDCPALAIPDVGLAEHTASWSPDDFARGLALEAIFAQTFGGLMRRFRPPSVRSPYGEALAGYAFWRSPTASPSRRYGALRFSFDTLRALCGVEPSLARLSTFARVAWDLGERKACVESLNRILALVGEARELREPFWPASPRFDRIVFGPDLGRWFFIAVLEQVERAAQHSSMFGPSGANLEWLSAQSMASTEMLRRHVLRRLRAGEHVMVPERLCREAPDHINAGIWRAGAVLTCLPATGPF